MFCDSCTCVRYALLSQKRDLRRLHVLSCAGSWAAMHTSMPLLALRNAERAAVKLHTLAVMLLLVCYIQYTCRQQRRCLHTAYSVQYMTMTLNVQAAEKLYKRARKLRRAVDAVAPLLLAVQQEIAYLEEVGTSMCIVCRECTHCVHGWQCVLSCKLDPATHNSMLRVCEIVLP